MTTASLNPRQNKLLAALPDVELLRLEAELDGVELHQGQALYESGNAISYAYFPTTAVVSMVYEFEDGALAETAVGHHQEGEGSHLQRAHAQIGGDQCPRRSRARFS